MHPLLVVSLVVNVAVLLPVTFVLLRDGEPARFAWGPRTEGRQILLAIYLAILVLSCGLLVWGEPRMAAGLLLAQVIYKLLSPLTVGTLKNPVVVSNLAIATLHAVTLNALLRG
jgi:hypothetical protein